jgi:hypothetical protein
MNESISPLPLAEVLRAVNGLVEAGLIEDYAIGGALAAIHYVEPFATYDADIFFVPADKSLTAGMPAIYSHLKSRGWQVEGEHLMVKGFPVQFLAAQGLTEEAVREARSIKFKGVPARVSAPNTLWPSRPARGGKRTWPASNRCCSRPSSTGRSWKKFWNDIN